MPGANKLEYIKKAGKAVSNILKRLKEEIKPGVSGKDLDKLAQQLMEKEAVQSSSLGYRVGNRIFPSAICVSLNKELTHGVPDDRVFKEGDLVSFDVACHVKNKKGTSFHADAAMTVLIKAGNEEDKEKQNLLLVTEKALLEVIKNIKPGITTSQDIGDWIEKYVQSYTQPQYYYVIKEYGGHGIGKKLHQEPFIPNYKTPDKGEIIKEGMFICIEPLVQIGDDKVDVSDNGWTVFSKNGYLNAHFEHTVYIDKEEAKIITNYAG